MKTLTEHDVSDEDQSGNRPGAPVTLVAFHPGARPAAAEKAYGVEESALEAEYNVSVIVTYRAFSTFTLLHFGAAGSEGTIIVMGSEEETLSLEPSVLVETVESIPFEREPLLALVLEGSTYTWKGSGADFILVSLHNGVHTVVGRKPGTGLKLLTTRHPVSLSTPA